MTPLGFYLLRPNFLKVFGPLIDYLVTARRAEFQVIVLVPQWVRSRPEFTVDPSVIEKLWGDRVTVWSLPTVQALEELIQRGSLAAFINLQPMVHGMGSEDVRRLKNASRRAGVKWVALPELFSQDQILVDDIEAAVEDWDLICTLGPRSLRYVEKHLNGASPTLARTLLDRLVVTGYPELDGLESLSDAASIRGNYGLPSDRPIVYVSTAPAFYPYVGTGWSLRGLKGRFRGEFDASLSGLIAHATSLAHPVLVSYRQYLSALRQFADRNGACLVAKTRPKHHDPAFLPDYVDCVIGDRCFFPFTTLELLSVSSLYFGFYSSTVLEALALGVYSITAMFVPIAAAEPRVDWREKSAYYDWGAEGLWSRPGVSTIVWGDRFSARGILERFSRSELRDYKLDDHAREAVLGDFLSHLGGSSERVVDALAACL